MKKNVTFILVLVGLLPALMVLGQNDKPIILEEVLLNGQTINLEKGFRLHEEGLKEAQKFTFKLSESVPKLVDIHCTGAHGNRAIFLTKFNLSSNKGIEITENGKTIIFNMSSLVMEYPLEMWENNPERARLVLELYKEESEDSFLQFTIPIIVD